MDRNKIVTALLGLLTLVALGFVLKAAQPVVLPLTIAWLLSYILGPVLNALARRRVPAGLAVSFMLVMLLMVGYLLIIFLHARVTAFAIAYPKYQERFDLLLARIAQSWDLEWNPFAGIQWGDQVRGWLVALSGSLFTFVSRLVMVLIFLVFLLLGKPYFDVKVRRAFDEDTGQRIARVIHAISNQIGRYLVVQFLISLVTGVLVWLALRVLKVDFAVTWGALAFLLNFIPTVGSIAASVPPILLAFIQYHPNMLPAVLTLLSLLAIQFGIGNVIAPKVLGDRLNLSPVVVLLSLVFWGWLWGVTGAILSVPLAAAMKIVCENVKALHPIAVMMGSGRALAREEVRERRHAS